MFSKNADEFYSLKTQSLKISFFSKLIPKTAISRINMKNPQLYDILQKQKSLKSVISQLAEQ